MAEKEYYGGAYDIDPYSFWTKDDFIELQYKIQDILDKYDLYNAQVSGIFESDDIQNQIEVDYVSDIADGTVAIYVDLNTIQAPEDLLNYAKQFADQIIKEISDIADEYDEEYIGSACDINCDEDIEDNTSYMETYYNIMNILDAHAVRFEQLSPETIAELDRLAESLGPEPIKYHIESIADANDCGDCSTWQEVVDCLSDSFANGDRI